MERQQCGLIKFCYNFCLFKQIAKRRHFYVSLVTGLFLLTLLRWSHIHVNIVTVVGERLALARSDVITSGSLLHFPNITRGIEATKHPEIHELSAEEPFLSRILGVQKRCSERKPPTHYLTSTRFKYDDNLRLVMCETPKVASTTWQILFLRLGGFGQEITKKLIYKWAYSIIPNKHFRQLSREEDAWERVNNYTTFLLTRHPFERLVSAYRDKLTNHTNIRAYRRKIGMVIAKQQAEDYLHGIKNVNLLTKISEASVKAMKEFKELSPMHQTDVLKYLHVLKTGEVSFPQFVKFLIGFYEKNEVDKMDIHWRPQVNLCMPCAFNYSYIIRFENITSESNRLLDYVQRNNIKSPLPEKVVFPQNEKPSVHDEQTTKAFKLIPEKDVEILRKIYSDDFYILNHDPYLYTGY